MKRIIAILLVIMMIASTCCFANSIDNVENNDNIELLTKVFKIDPSQIFTLFTDEFMTEITMKQLNDTILDIKKSLGEFIGIEPELQSYNIEFERGILESKMLIDNGKIDGLWFVKLNLKADNIDLIVADIEKMGYEYSICVKKNDKEVIFDKNKDEVMNVASTYGLFVLKELDKAIKGNRVETSDIVELNEEHKSYPSGILQTWPVDTPVTIATLANLMISINDNTAADHLAEFIGKRKIEKYMRKEDKPFLETNEFARLKFGGNTKLLEEYIKSDLKGRKEILAKLNENTNSTLNEDIDKPVAIKQVGYFFSTNELCDTIYDVKDCSCLKLNAGVLHEKGWYRVCHKGGTEPGVVNITYLFQKTEESDIYTVSMTLNDEEKLIDYQSATNLIYRIIDAIDKQ